MVSLTDRLAQDAEGFEIAANPSDVREGDIIHHATEAVPFSAGVAEIKGPGWVTLYETRTGEPRVINKRNLASALKKVHKDPAYPEMIGKKLFSERQLKPYVLGTYKCFLHPDQPERAEYDRMGLASCASAHLASQAQADRHGLKKHKDEWSVTEQTRLSKERREEREFQRAQAVAMTSALQALAARQGGAAPQTAGQVSGQCPDCEFISHAKSRKNLAANLRSHRSRKHRSS